MISTTDDRPETRGEAPGGGLPGAVAAEWIKVWSLRSTYWTLGICAVLWLGVAVAVASARNVMMTAGAPMPVAESAYNGFTLAHYVLIVFAALLVTGEYGTQSIRTSAQAVPVRGRLLTAKLIVTGGIAATTGLVLSALAIGVGALLLGTDGEFDSARAAEYTVTIAVFTALMCVMICGVGTALRSTAGTITLAFVVFSVLGTVLWSIAAALQLQWLMDAAEYLPGEAGAALIRPDLASYDQPVALGVLLAWTAAAVVAGYAVLRSRDV